MLARRAAMLRGPTGDTVRIPRLAERLVCEQLVGCRLPLQLLLPAYRTPPPLAHCAAARSCVGKRRMHATGHSCRNEKSV
jgi:hypothetical protein